MFENSLIESQHRKGPKNKMVVIPLAILFHVVVFVGVLFAQYWSIEPVPEPPIQVSFFQASAPPPPPPPPPPPKPAAPKPVAVVPQPSQTPVQPVVVPDKPPEPSPPQEASSGTEGGVEGGVEGGQTGGVPGGVPSSVVEEILHVGGDVTPPVALERVPPVYTEIARRARISGVVIVEAIIDKTGAVTNVRVLKGLPMGLSEAAVEAVKRWRFNPARLNGQPVNVYFTLTVNFRLQ